MLSLLVVVGCLFARVMGRGVVVLANFFTCGMWRCLRAMLQSQLDGREVVV